MLSDKNGARMSESLFLSLTPVPTDATTGACPVMTTGCRSPPYAWDMATAMMWSGSASSAGATLRQARLHRANSEFSSSPRQGVLDTGGQCRWPTIVIGRGGIRTAPGNPLMHPGCQPAAGLRVEAVADGMLPYVDCLDRRDGLGL